MNQKPNILVVDDEKSNIDILINLFKNSDVDYHVIPTLSAQKAFQAIEKREIDLILLDIVMPVMDGFEMCAILKSKEETKNIPVLFITSSNDDDSIEKAYVIGAADYVTKPFRAVELLARVKQNLDLKNTIAQLEHLAYYDMMTNIYNRRKFFELANLKFETQKENLYGVMIDIDKFKNINDNYGHHTGDQVIKNVANTIKSFLKESMVFGRLGGEEFGIILNMASNEEVFEFLENIRKEISQMSVIVDENTQINFTISDGIAKYAPEMTKIDHLLQKADEALYEAKESGRNKTIFRL